MINNYVTSQQARVKSDKNISEDKLDELLEIATKTLASTDTLVSKANLNGVIVQFTGNSKHQFDFWNLNWWLADPDAAPNAYIYSVQGAKGMEPSAFYCPSRYTAVFLNTDYYGQCKSWALGASAHILEDFHETHSIHGASIEVGGKGVIIIAPTGTGKTTQAFRLMLRPEGKIMGDDWVYVPHDLRTRRDGRPTARQPERSLYMRTETEANEAWLREIFDKCSLENVIMRKEDCEHTIGEDGCRVTGKKCVFNQGKEWCYYAFENARAMVPRELLLGKDKVADETFVNLVVLLERVPGNPPERRLNSHEAIEVLRKGQYTVRPGAGPREMWGKLGSEAYYNPYLLRLDPEKQDHYFVKLFEDYGVPCVLLNTANETVEQTHSRIMRALDESDELA